MEPETESESELMYLNSAPLHIPAYKKMNVVGQGIQRLEPILEQGSESETETGPESESNLMFFNFVPLDIPAYKK